MGGGQLNKAFTLIELLAIIVILAIIAIITIPIILNVVDNAKKGAAIDSAYGYKDSVYKSFLSDMFDDSTKELPNGTYTLTETGKLVRSEPLSELTVDVQGDVPSEGWMELVKGEVVAFSLKFDEYTVTKYKDTDPVAVKNGDIAENTIDRENRLETERQARAIEKAKTLVLGETGETEIKDITEGWVLFIDGTIKAYSVSITEGDYTYIVTDLDVNDDNSNASASRLTTELEQKTSGEQILIDYYSEQVATETSTYIEALLNDDTIKSYTKDTGKKVSEITTVTKPSDMDDNSWIFFEKGDLVTAHDYSIKMTKGEYSFVVNCVGGIVSDPVYNGELASQKTKGLFADASWAAIKNNLSHDRNHYPIGSEKIVNMNLEGTPKDYKLRLVNTEDCGDYTGSRTSCGVVIEFVTIIGTHVMNSNHRMEGGWSESEMRAYLNTETDSSSNPTSIYSKLPSDLKDIIILTSPVMSSSGASDSKVLNVAEDYLYLLTYKELGFDLVWDSFSDTAKTLKYYSDNNNNAARIKYATATGSGGSGERYWLRWSLSGSANLIERDGSDYGYDPGSRLGVAPAFRILD